MTREGGWRSDGSGGGDFGVALQVTVEIGGRTKQAQVNGEGGSKMGVEVGTKKSTQPKRKQSKTKKN